MENQKHIKVLVAILMVVAIASCQEKGEKRGDGIAKDSLALKQVYVDCYPLYYLASRIGGEQVKVFFPARGDVDPAFWMPYPEAVSGFQSADLVFINGKDYAHWLNRIQLPEDRVVNTIEDLTSRLITTEAGRSNYHLWMDPLLVLEQARVVTNAFCKLVADSDDEFESRFKLLEQDLRNLDKENRELLNGRKGQVLLVAGQVYDYFFQAYGLEVMHFNWNGREVSQEGEWARFKAYYQKYHWKKILCSEMPSLEVVEKLEKYGVEPLLLNSCSNVCAEGDFLEVLRQNTRQIRKLIE